MVDIKSYEHLKSELLKSEKSYLLLYKDDSEISECALKTLEGIENGFKKITLGRANVKKARDIHVNFNITTVPSLLEFDKGEFTNVIKGCNSKSFYKALFEEALYRAEIKESGKKQKRVTVYSTPTCTWCNTLKTYLKQNRIQFTDIDVSKDQKAAEEMVRKSGQQGVPQTDIEGQMIIGFDKSKINKLLDIKSK